MAEHALPDDPKDWPADPFALLGVPRAVSETDLKRAYTRLIRKYKPEHAPDEFRRIRAAYEAAVEVSRWFRDAPTREPLPDLPFVPVSPPESSHETQIDPPVRPAPPRDAVEAAWADAVAGDWAGAYAALVALAGEQPERADLPLRLYWLLALRPTLDAGRSRHDWLVPALRLARLGGPAAELYVRELSADPDNALCAAYLRLLELEDVPAGRLLALARARLTAAVAERRWGAVETDLEILARRWHELDEAAWLSYLADVHGLALYIQPSAAARCAALLGELRHLELRHGWAFDRFDEQQAAVRVWREATMVADPIRQAVAAMWAGTDCDAPLKTACAWAAADPLAALRKCDQATREGLVVLSAFGRLVSARRAVGSEYPPALLRGLTRAYLTNAAGRNYGLMRESLLRFLLDERIDPDELVEACGADSRYYVRSIVEHVRGDGVLHLVYRAACGTG